MKNFLKDLAFTIALAFPIILVSVCAGYAIITLTNDIALQLLFAIATAFLISLPLLYALHKIQ